MQCFAFQQAEEECQGLGYIILTAVGREYNILSRKRRKKQWRHERFLKKGGRWRGAREMISKGSRGRKGAVKRCGTGPFSFYSEHWRAWSKTSLKLMWTFYSPCHTTWSTAVAKLEAQNARHSLSFAVSLGKQQLLPYLPIIFTILLHCCKVLPMLSLLQRNRKGLGHSLSFIAPY